MPNLADREGVFAISTTAKQDRVADLVFVHGLGGGSHGTWRYGKEGDEDHFFWPEELAQDLPQCRVWTVGYDADVLRASGKGMVIGLRGLSVASLFESYGIGASKPVIFICHSMGGLVVKALIDGCRQNTNPYFERLVENIKGIAFCGTPHRGSEFANAARLLGKVLGGSTAWTREMCADEIGIELMHERFLGWLRHNPIPLLTVVEHSVSFGVGFLRLEIGIVVPRASAVLGHEAVHQHNNADHLQLVKPSHFGDITYSCTRKFILSLLSAPQEAANSNPDADHV